LLEEKSTQPAISHVEEREVVGRETSKKKSVAVGRKTDESREMGVEILF